MNLVELIDYDQKPSPCLHGNIVIGHACYCHSPAPKAPRKCPVWRNFAEDESKWHADGDFNADDWNGGCKMFEPKAKPRCPSTGELFGEKHE